MTIEVELFSNETIKPSSPTPNNLRHYQFSFLDQLNPKVYIPLVFYYASNINGYSEISIHLKKSLSEALTLYYPLAGRVKNDTFIDCNDEGIPFIDAQVKAQLSDVTEKPLPPCELNKFLPFELDCHTEAVLGVQLNIFESGGIAIGVCISHKIGDGLSCITFINSWMAIARGEANVVRSEFISSALFPPKKDLGFHQRSSAIAKKNNIVSKRFEFDSLTIEALRTKYEQNTNLEEGNDKRRTSRVEALSAFIYSRFMAATSTGSNPKKLYIIFHPVNIRPKVDPPLPEHSFGNFCLIGVTVPSSNIIVQDPNCYGLVKQVRETIRKVDEGYVKKVQEGDDMTLNFLMESAKEAMIEEAEIVTLSFTSLCWFPFYEADFGWGKPIWVSSAQLTIENVVSFRDGRTKGGIEAYICFKEEDMAKFEADQEFQAFLNFS
ncbi:hypothetical protein UlMin_040080 [Ulmus minor]